MLTESSLAGDQFLFGNLKHKGVLARLFDGHGNLQAIFRLFPFQITRIAQQAHLGHLAR